MNELIKQGLIAHKANIFPYWYGQLTTEQRQEFDIAIQRIAQNIVDTFSPIREQFQALGQKIAESLAEVSHGR